MTLLGSSFELPEPAPAGYVLVGDTASLPAINSLLEAIGEALVETVRASAFDASDHFGWVACDNRTTRSVVKVLREDYQIPKKSIKARAYWEA